MVFKLKPPRKHADGKVVVKIIISFIKKYKKLKIAKLQSHRKNLRISNTIL